MRVAFLGTPAAAVPALAALSRVASVDLVITRSDKVQGRSGTPKPSPVREAASQWGFPVELPETARGLTSALRRSGAEMGIVVAYGRILGRKALDALPGGFLNVHFSYLPRWRGAAPVSHAILNGDSVTGVSVIVVDEGLDTGPVVARSAPVQVGDHDRGSLTAALAAVGAALLAETLPPYSAGIVSPEPQDESNATAAPRLTRAGARLDLAAPAVQVRRQIRALAPKPGAWAQVDGSALRVLGAGDVGSGSRPAGSVTAEEGRVWLWCGDGRVELAAVQPAGRRRIDATAWWHGRRGRSTLLV